LVDAKVEAVIGPFTSSMAEVIVPITGKAEHSSQPDHYVDGVLWQGRQSVPYHRTHAR
jgi:hypothetical protein